jgi:hypothetical protein
VSVAIGGEALADGPDVLVSRKLQGPQRDLVEIAGFEISERDTALWVPILDRPRTAAGRIRESARRKNIVGCEAVLAANATSVSHAQLA